MPVLKPISGHTSVKPAMRYLEKKNRALAVDFVNIDAPAEKSERLAFDWASVMDRTRRESGNDIPWRAKRVRTYKHYIISPDPEDGIDLEALQDLAASWAREHFGDYEVAIVYHDDNERGIPHAHVVVNNTNLATGRRLQDPDPTGLNHSLQRMANERRMNYFPGLSGPSSATGRTEKQFLHHPKSLQREYVRSAEAALIAKGEYSWTADIRARVRIANRRRGQLPESSTPRLGLQSRRPSDEAHLRREARTSLRQGEAALHIRAQRRRAPSRCERARDCAHREVGARSRRPRRAQPLVSGPFGHRGEQN